MCFYCYGLGHFWDLFAKTHGWIVKRETYPCDIHASKKSIQSTLSERVNLQFQPVRSSLGSVVLLNLLHSTCFIFRFLIYLDIFLYTLTYVPNDYYQFRRNNNQKTQPINRTELSLPFKGDLNTRKYIKDITLLHHAEETMRSNAVKHNVSTYNTKPAL